MKTPEQIREMIRDARTCMMSTLDDTSQKIKSRPMSIASVDDMNRIWFFTSDESSKVSEMKNTWELALGFANDADSEWISVNGAAQLVKDKERMKDLWNPTYKAWFPQGLDTPDLALICVEMDSAEYWESKGGKLATMFEMAKAAITGQPAQNSEHAKVMM